MAIHHRKFLSANDSSLYTCSFTDDCGDQYINGYCLRCVQISPQRPPPVRQKSPEAHVLPYLISAVCALGIAFLILITCTILIRYRFSQRRRRRVLDSTQETVFVDEDHGPIIDHPIWHIVTVGLPQSVIDSITSFKYKRGSNGLIEGTDCSVCLTEFEDGDDLRLLPKCSHAFHLPCIDTWLRSHKNCPLCRAPVNPESHDQARQLGETSQIRDRDRDRANDDFDNLPIEGVRIAEILKRNRENRMLSDLGENCRIINEDFQQPVRRSISMDASAASAISSAVVYNVAMSAGEGSSKRDKRVIEAEKGAKRVRRDSSMSRLIKSSSIGLSLQKAPVSMKRSLSSTSSNIFSSFRGSKSQSSSVLPL